MKQITVIGRRGAMMLTLLVIFVAAGIVALQMLPDEDLALKRSTETVLQAELSQIREAFDLKTVSVGGAPGDLSAAATPQEVETAIEDLSREGFLRNENIKDPTSVAGMWGVSSANYWRVVDNIASNTSFELDIDQWQISKGSVIDLDAQRYPRTTGLDDYPYQNKLGNILKSSGRALKVTK
ncbi:MAG: hypothetical protein EOM80_14125 [Erysipelotrichia bacterium]|nr:hypothetical protein [Candidatus Riflebacteria bacterium]NCB39898.1 hypothetical protein [Erysipelotrichia bacterium]